MFVVATLACGTTVPTPAPDESSSGFGGIDRAAQLILLGYVLEHVSPDLRLESGVDTSRTQDLVLAWPVNLWWFQVVGPRYGRKPPPVVVNMNVFGEAQLRGDDLDVGFEKGTGWRGLGGLRFAMHPKTRFALITEGGALVDRGGTGGFVGGGLAFAPVGRDAYEELPWLVAVITRYHWTGGEDRVDVTLDLQLPLFGWM